MAVMKGNTEAKVISDREMEALLDGILAVIAAQPAYLNGRDQLRNLLSSWMPRPEPGGPEWEAMVERAYKTFYANANFGGSRGRVEAALRAALAATDTGGTDDAR